ncbi:MAG: phenylalanine--tRNA ligase subunit beta, partial [Patescibacteria group bacterium]
MPDERRQFQALPFYPQVERDLAMIVPEGVKYKEIEEAMEKHDPLLKAVALFDVYHGLNEGASLAFRLTFGSTDRTLEAKEVDEAMEKLKDSLTKKLKVFFR